MVWSSAGCGGEDASYSMGDNDCIPLSYISVQGLCAGHSLETVRLRTNAIHGPTRDGANCVSHPTDQGYPCYLASSDIVERHCRQTHACKNME